MKRLAWAALGALVANACAAAACWYDVPDVTTMVDSGGPEAATDAAPTDAGTDVMDAGCNPDAPFGTPVVVPGFANPSYDERYPRLSPDELTIYYAFGPSSGPFVLFTASRTSTTTPFGAGSPIAGLTGGSGSDNNITVSSDGLTALISSTRTQSSVNPNVSQIWSTLRTSPSSAFLPPAWSNTTFGSQNGDFDPYFVTGNLFYYAHLPINGSVDLSAASVVVEPDAGIYGAGPAVDISNLNSSADDRAPVVTPDELTIYFASNRGSDGGTNVWTSSRPSNAIAWQTPWMVAELAGFGNPRPGWISADGCRLYLTSRAAGSDDIYLATRGK